MAAWGAVLATSRVARRCVVSRSAASVAGALSSFDCAGSLAGAGAAAGASTGAYFLFRALWGDRRAAVVGGLAYGLSPFVLGHITGQSALLLPFSALPWLISSTRISPR